MIFHAIGNEKKVVGTQYSYQTKLTLKQSIKKVKEGQYIMIKESMQEDITFINIYARNTCCCCCWCYVASVVSDSVQSHRQQPTRLRHPWDSPGKNTGVGCHFLLQHVIHRSTQMQKKKKNTNRHKREVDWNKIKEDFNIPFTSMERFSRQKIK